jgi:hypothetical protein
MLLDQVVRALNERSWPDHIARHLGPAVGDAVAPYLRLVIGARIAETRVLFDGDARSFCSTSTGTRSLRTRSARATSTWSSMATPSRPAGWRRPEILFEPGT